ncbi:MAG: hypothetical protein V2B14_04805 [bacterium]
MSIIGKVTANLTKKSIKQRSMNFLLKKRSPGFKGYAEKVLHPIERKKLHPIEEGFLSKLKSLVHKYL